MWATAGRCYVAMALLLSFLDFSRCSGFRMVFAACAAVMMQAGGSDRTNILDHSFQQPFRTAASVASANANELRVSPQEAMKNLRVQTF